MVCLQWSVEFGLLCSELFHFDLEHTSIYIPGAVATDMRLYGKWPGLSRKGKRISIYNPTKEVLNFKKIMSLVLLFQYCPS